MKHQHGAALVIVMALLVGASLVGMSGMQSALIDERLAGNYRATTQARMNAEIAAASALNEDALDFFTLNAPLSDLQSMSWFELSEQFSDDQQALNYGCERNGLFECVYIPMRVTEGRYVMAKGVTGGRQRGMAESNAILLRYVTGGEMKRPFSSAITSCQDIALKGGASINGGVIAGNNISITGGASLPSSASAGGKIGPERLYTEHPQVTENYQDGEGEDGYRFSEACDSLGVFSEEENVTYFETLKSDLGVVDAAQWLQEQGLEHYYQENNDAFTFTGGRDNQDASTSYLGVSGGETTLNIGKDLNTSGRLNRLVVDGTVNLFVEGEFDLGDTTSLEISKGAVLNLYVSGKVTLSAGSQLALGAENFMRQDSAGVERPAVSIYSDYQDSGNGVTISGGNDTYAAIYAPGSKVDISGGGALYGGLRAQNVVMSGGSSLSYVDDLADYEMKAGEQGNDQPSFDGWTEVQ